MWVKICGITSLEDAQLAVEAGADAIGFVFGPSRRQVTARGVARIAEQLPESIDKIGLFVDETPERIADTITAAGLTGVQLQGNESAEVIRALRRLNLRLLIRTVWASARLDTLAERIAAQAADADGILLDSGSVTARGGTGTAFDWNGVAAQLGGIPAVTRLIVAGGLNAANVATAIATLSPWGVDVASGVEREPGRKDPDKVRAFVAAARAARVGAMAYTR